MFNFRMMNYKRRIGLIGIYFSGKTVFLTSLINHLQHHVSTRFRLRSEKRKSESSNRSAPIRTGPSLIIRRRDAMLYNRKWPKKTTDRSQFVFTFERSDWKFGGAKVKLFDMPGERIADAAMAGMDFASWSDYMIKFIRNDTAYREHAQEYLASIDQALPEADVVRFYKLALARLIHAYKPYISPLSVHLLDTRGQQARNVAPEQLAAECSSGIDGSSEFVPLPKAVREGDPRILGLFTDRYDRYKHEVVLPLIANLRTCDSLIVLVDITMLLAGGTGMYNDNRQLIVDLLEVPTCGRARIEEDSLRRAKALTSVHPMDRDKMVALLREMTEGCVRDRDRILADYFNCSAVVSTVVPDPGKRVLGMISDAGHDGQEQSIQYDVSSLPDCWPDKWESGRYSFPEASPRWPERKDSPPKQINLDKIFEFVIH